MKSKFKISLPKPCIENWDNMHPNDLGRFCSSCSKSVIDFTKMEKKAIEAYFQANFNQKICGRFKTEQLDSLIISIPENTFYSQNQFPKMFFLALLFCMGTTLFSCKDEKGEKKKIDKVEIVKKSIESHATVGITLPEKPSEINLKKNKEGNKKWCKPSSNSIKEPMPLGEPALKEIDSTFQEKIGKVRIEITKDSLKNN